MIFPFLHKIRLFFHKRPLCCMINPVGAVRYAADNFKYRQCIECTAVDRCKDHHAPGCYITKCEWMLDG